MVAAKDTNVQTVAVDTSSMTGDDLTRVCVEFCIKVGKVHNEGVLIPDGGLLLIITDDVAECVMFNGKPESWVEDMDRVLSSYKDLVGAVYINYAEHIDGISDNSSGMKDIRDMDARRMCLSVNGANVWGEYCFVAAPLVGDRVIYDGILLKTGKIGKNGETDNVKSLFLDAFAYNMGYGKRVFS